MTRPFTGAWLGTLVTDKHKGNDVNRSVSGDHDFHDINAYPAPVFRRARRRRQLRRQAREGGLLARCDNERQSSISPTRRCAA